MTLAASLLTAALISLAVAGWGILDDAEPVADADGGAQEK